MLSLMKHPRVWLLVLLAVLLVAAHSVKRVEGHRMEGEAEAESEADSDSDAEIDQSVFDSMAAEIQDQLDTEQELNAGSDIGGQSALDSESSEAAELNLSEELDAREAQQAEAEAEQQAQSEAAQEEAQKLQAISAITKALSKDGDMSFLSGQEHASASAVEKSVAQFDGVDVEQHLDIIAAEIGSAMGGQNANRQQQVQEEAQQTRKHARKHRRSIRARAHAAAAAAPAPSARQQKLINRIDGYRASRGYQFEQTQAKPVQSDLSIIESASKSSAGAANGYSAPGLFVAPTAPVAAVGAPAFSPFAGQVALNPVAQSNENALLAQLGYGPVTAPVTQLAAPVPQAAATNVAGLGTLLAALKQVQEREQTNSMLKKLASLIAVANTAQQTQAVAAPAVINSPFNAFQPLVNTPQGWQNPNLAPVTPFGAPRLLPGQIPGQSPSYPTYIPSQSAKIGVEDAQENPFADHPAF